MSVKVFPIECEVLISIFLLAKGTVAIYHLLKNKRNALNQAVKVNKQLRIQKSRQDRESNPGPSFIS